MSKVSSFRRPVALKLVKRPRILRIERDHRLSQRRQQVVLQVGAAVMTLPDFSEFRRRHGPLRELDVYVPQVGIVVGPQPASGGQQVGQGCRPGVQAHPLLSQVLVLVQQPGVLVAGEVPLEAILFLNKSFHCLLARCGGACYPLPVMRRPMTATARAARSRTMGSGSCISSDKTWLLWRVSVSNSCRVRLAVSAVRRWSSLLMSASWAAWVRLGAVARKGRARI